MYLLDWWGRCVLNAWGFFAVTAKMFFVLVNKMKIFQAFWFSSKDSSSWNTLSVHCSWITVFVSCWKLCVKVQVFVESKCLLHNCHVKPWISMNTLTYYTNIYTDIRSTNQITPLIKFLFAKVCVWRINRIMKLYKVWEHLAERGKTGRRPVPFLSAVLLFLHPSQRGIPFAPGRRLSRFISLSSPTHVSG